ncbi:MAG: bacteriohemerythrin [Magnetococcus sp. DMHC-8]
MTAQDSWNPLWNTGVANVDAEHLQLLEIWQSFQMNYRDLSPAVIGSLLNELIEYATYHFDHEEQQLAQRHYDRLPEHQAAHQQLLATALDFCDQLKTTHDRASLAAEVGTFFQRWIIQHILTMDQTAFREG